MTESVCAGGRSVSGSNHGLLLDLHCCSVWRRSSKASNPDLLLQPLDIGKNIFHTKSKWFVPENVAAVLKGETGLHVLVEALEGWL